jgi:hypothetical protein
MRDAILHQRIHKRHGHMILSRNIRETLWPVFSCKNLICHIERLTKKRKLGQPINSSCSRTRSLYCIARRQATLLGAEGASASMADRAVRAARL